MPNSAVDAIAASGSGQARRREIAQVIGVQHAPVLRITLGVDLADQMGMTAFAINSARHDLLDHM